MTTTTLDRTDTQAQPDTVFHRPARARRHAVIGYKGGAGKTTCVLCIAEAAARQGKNVLVVDMDGQGNATRRLHAHDLHRPTLADVLHPVNAVPIMDAVTVCGWDTDEWDWAARIHVVQAPSNEHTRMGLEQLETRTQEAHYTGAFARLRAALAQVPEGVYDLIVIDTAPNLGHGLDMVLAALEHPDDRLWLCVNPLMDSLTGGQRFYDHVYKHRANLLVPHLDVHGVVVNDYRPSLDVHAQVYPTIPGAFACPVLPQYLPRHDRWQEVCNNGMPLAAFPELYRRHYPGKGEPPHPSFADRVEELTGAIINAD